MRILLCISIILAAGVSATAQKDIEEDTGWSLKERGFVGLGFGGLSFGSSSYYGSYFSVGVSAQAGYMLTPNLSAGIGLEYQYTNYKDLKLKNNVYVGYPLCAV